MSDLTDQMRCSACDNPWDWCAVAGNPFCRRSSDGEHRWVVPVEAVTQAIDAIEADASVTKMEPEMGTDYDAGYELGAETALAAMRAAFTPLAEGQTKPIPWPAFVEGPAAAAPVEGQQTP